MNTIVCYKVVYEEQDIVVNDDSSLSFDRAELKLSLYDLNAVEAAVCLSEETDGKTVAMTIGDSKVDNSKMKKAILSRGPQELCIVPEETFGTADTSQTAKVLAASVAKLEYDVIFCGEGSADNYAQQTGIQLGELLGLPVVNSVSKVTVDGDKLIVERTLESSVEVIEVPTPAVICVTSDINKTRLPNMKDILAAGKKPVTTLSVADLGIDMPEKTLDIISVVAPTQKERKCQIFEGEDKVTEFYDSISKEIK